MLDFFFKGQALAAGSMPNKSFDAGGWSLIVTATCSAFVDGAARILYQGEQLTGIAKLPWSKVSFADGTEGWVPATSVALLTNQVSLLISRPAGKFAYMLSAVALKILYCRGPVDP